MKRSRKNREESDGAGKTTAPSKRKTTPEEGCVIEKSPTPNHNEEWLGIAEEDRRFFSMAEALFAAMIGVCALFEQNDLCYWIVEAENDDEANQYTIALDFLEENEGKNDRGGGRFCAKNIGFRKPKKIPQIEKKIKKHKDIFAQRLKSWTQSWIQRQGALAGQSGSKATLKMPPLSKNDIPVGFQLITIPKEQNQDTTKKQWPANLAVCVGNFLDYISCTARYKDQVCYRKITEASSCLPPAESNYAEKISCISPQVLQTLRGFGINELYSHQVEAIHTVLREKKNIIITTPTSSGKSLSYVVPIMEAFIADKRSKAFCMFPTKALAQDQLKSLKTFAECCCPALRLECFDGDTPKAIRDNVRESNHVFLLNPDILHVTILPSHHKWRKILADLKYIVIDEAHMYRGAFGSHVSLVLRRFLRVCSMHGSTPQIICCSATIANPEEHMANLIGLDPKTISLIDQDGAPKGSKQFAIWNPSFRHESPQVAQESSQNHEESNVQQRTANRRDSPYKDTAFLLAELMKHGLRTIVFVKVRSIAELVLQLTKELLPAELRSKVACYRAGYTAEERRGIEKSLHSGDLLAVCSTNALELGVDIGHLDATLHVGFPSTVCSLLQQAGRAGRNVAGRPKDSLAILIALDSPLDQYFANASGSLFRRPIEQAIIDPTNAYILQKHLHCALHELPVSPEFLPGVTIEDNLVASFGMTSVNLLNDSLKHGYIRKDHDGVSRLSVKKSPVHGINLRSIDNITYTIINRRTGKVMETLDSTTAFLQVYEGAVYLHQGDSYLVDELNLEEKKAYLQRKVLNYFTQPKDHSRVSILGRKTERALTGTSSDCWNCQVYSGPVSISKSIYAYRKVDKRTFKTEDVIDVYLPECEYETSATWIEFPAEVRKRLKDAVNKGYSNNVNFDYDSAGLHAIEHVVIALCPLIVMSESADLSCQHTRRKDDANREKLLIYETHRGGMGLVKRIADNLEVLLSLSRDIILKCNCFDGCVSCIHLGNCGEYNEGLSKKLAIELLNVILGPKEAPPDI